MNVSKVFSVVFVLTIVSCLFSYSLISTPFRHGDGHEYSLMVKAFVNHASPDIRIADIDSRIADVGNNKSGGFVLSFFDAFKTGILNNVSDVLGLYKSFSGKYYGYHFWFYSLLVSIVEFVSVKFGANPLSSFQITNAILLCLTIFLCFSLKTSITRNSADRCQMVLIFLLSGVLFYLKWSHPEVFIFTLLYSAFLCLFFSRRKLAWFLAGLAGIQVISLWVIFGVFAIELLLSLDGNLLDKFKSLFKKHYAFLLFSCLPCVSAVFYYLNFGKISLIGTSYTDLELISFSHLLSFWFDLDQGVFVGAPVIIALVFLALLNFKKLMWEARLHLFFAIVAAMLICIPLLAQTSVNSGQSIFFRYALYAVSPLAAWSSLYFTFILPKMVWRMIFIFFGFVYVSWGASDKEDFLEHKPWTSAIMNISPTLYNPEPGIFFARSNHFEWSKHSNVAAFYANDEGTIRKILFPLANSKKAFQSICAGNIIDQYGKPIDSSKFSSERYGWAYMNGEFKCDGYLHIANQSTSKHYALPISSGIDFTRAGLPDFVENVYGLSGEEPWGRWSDGKAVAFLINTKLKEVNSINLLVGGYGDNVGRQVKVTCNKSTDFFLLSSAEPKQYHVRCPLMKDSDNWIVFYPPKPFSPYQNKESTDTRQIGISFVEMTFNN